MKLELHISFALRHWLRHQKILSVMTSMQLTKKIVRKVVVFDGDFRLILHIIPRCTLFDIDHVRVKIIYMLRLPF